jgi:hypothetical protein
LTVNVPTYKNIQTKIGEKNHIRNISVKSVIRERGSGRGNRISFGN